MRWAVVVLALATPAAGQEITLPSGRIATFFDLITDRPGPAGRTYRFRFLDPQIALGGTETGIDDRGADMDHLCSEFVLPRLATIGPPPQQVIISISDKPVEFGAADPGASQYFEAYSVEGGVCSWEGF